MDPLGKVPEIGEIQQKASMPSEEKAYSDVDNFFKSHELVGSKTTCIDEIRNAGRFFARVLLKNSPQCADRSASIRKIREAVWTAVYSVAADESVGNYMKDAGFDPKTELAPIMDTLKSDSYDLLHDWMEENMKDCIGQSGAKGGETALEIAIRVMSEYRAGSNQKSGEAQEK